MTETASSVLAKGAPTSHGASRSSVLHVRASSKAPGSPREPRESRAGFKLHQELRATFHESPLGHHVGVRSTERPDAILAHLRSRRAAGRGKNMLINTSPRRPNRERVRYIKEALRAALGLPDDATVTVTELACLEEGCAPIETVVALLRPDAPPLQHKFHKPTDAIDAADLVQVCEAWGFDVQIPIPAPLSQEN